VRPERRGHYHGLRVTRDAAALLLLIIGIHNAWDNVAFYVFVQMNKTDKE